MMRQCAPLKVIAGARGLAKVATRIGIASPEVVQARRDACRQCPEVTAGLTGLSTCKKCGCFIRAKTKVADETCPEGKW
jgi:hypothetical protein